MFVSKNHTDCEALYIHKYISYFVHGCMDEVNNYLYTFICNPELLVKHLTSTWSIDSAASTEERCINSSDPVGSSCTEFKLVRMIYPNPQGKSGTGQCGKRPDSKGNKSWSNLNSTKP